MQLVVHISDTLAERIKALADHLQESHEQFLTIALAERIARHEHLTWLEGTPAKGSTLQLVPKPPSGGTKE